MKVLRYLLIAGACAALLPDARGAAGTSAKEEKMRWAISVIMETLVPKVEEWPINPKMFDDPLRNVLDKDESMKKSRGKAREGLMSRFEKEAERQCNKLNVDKEWRDEALKSVRSRAGSAVDRNLSRNFSGVFGPLRKRTYEAQRRELNTGIYPSPGEVEEYIRTGESKALQGRLAERFSKAQSRAVYSENKDWFRDSRVPDVLKEAKKQYNEQMASVKKARAGAGEKTPSDIASGISGNIEKQRKEKEKQGRYAYALFPSVRKETAGRAHKLAVEGFLNALSRTKFPVPEARVSEIIRKDGLEKHSEQSASRNLCSRVFSKEIEGKAFDEYVKGMTPLKKKEMQELRKGISSSSPYKSALDSLTWRSLADSLSKVRKGISSRQMQELFSPLAERKWKPPIEMIEKYDNRVWLEIPDPLGVPGVSSGKVSSKEMLQETVSRVKEIEKELINKGLEALKRQKAIVRDVEGEMKKPETLEGMSSEEELREEFTGQVSEKYSGWSRDYKGLFPKVIKDIGTKADAIWNNERVRRRTQALAKIPSVQQPRTSTPQDKTGSSDGSTGSRGSGQNGQGGGQGEGQGKGRGGGGAGGSGGGAGGGLGGGQGGGLGGGTGENEPDVIIDLAYSGGWLKREKVLARIAFVKSRKVLGYSMAPQEGANDKILLNIQGHMESWLRGSVQGDKEVELYIVTRVFNWELFSGIIFDLQDCVSRALGKAGSKHLKVYWLNMRMKGKKYKEYKNKFNIPLDFKKKSTTVIA